MSDRVKSNSMQDVFHAAGNSANINFGKYAPKDKANPLGAREMSDTIGALIASNYNTGEYPVEYDATKMAQARYNINAANGGTEIETEFDTPLQNLEHANGNILEFTGTIPVLRSGSGDASADNVRNFLAQNKFGLWVCYGKNWLGGRTLLDYLKAHIPNGVADYTDNTFTCTLADTHSDVFPIGPMGAYKTRTQYTVILKIERLTGSGTGTNFRLLYSDSSNLDLSLPANSDGVQTIVAVTSSSKTLSSFYKRTTSTDKKLKIYCNESGIIEGNITAEEYEPFYGTDFIIDVGNTDNNVYGGEFNLKTGIFKPYKYYAEYNGETLVGEWVCNKAEYASGTTPPDGSAVIDLGAFGDDIPLGNILPIFTQKPVKLNVTRATNVTVKYETDTNALIQSLLSRVATLESGYNSLDARVTALENPEAQTTALNPGNSTLEIDHPEINTFDPAISTPDVEPTEPTENM